MKKLLFILILFGVHSSAISQSAPPADAYAYFTSGTPTPGFFKVTLPATQGIAAIKVRLGSAQGIYDLVDYVFVFDVTSGLPAGYSYARNNTELTLGIGSFEEPNTSFGEVLLQDASGNWSTPLQFISN